MLKLGSLPYLLQGQDRDLFGRVGHVLDVSAAFLQLPAGATDQVAPKYTPPEISDISSSRCAYQFLLQMSGPTDTGFISDGWYSFLTTNGGGWEM